MRHAGSPATRSVGRVAVRSLGVATSALRPAPDFVIIGAKRAGTTSLYRYLLGHPQVLSQFPSARRLPLRADTKGVHYFDTGWRHGSAWYRSHFPSATHRYLSARRLGASVSCGEASPYYLFHPLAAHRARSAVPEARIIALLRNPADRAFSHYGEQRRRGMEPLPTFDEALAAEPERLRGEAERLVEDPGYRSFAHEHQSYVGQGRYLQALEPWLSSFPPEQLCILRSEDFYAEPERVYGEVLEFLGLESVGLSDQQAFNAGEGQTLDPERRARLQNEFAQDNVELERRLGRSFGWNES